MCLLSVWILVGDHFFEEAALFIVTDLRAIDQSFGVGDDFCHFSAREVVDCLAAELPLLIDKRGFEVSLFIRLTLTL